MRHFHSLFSLYSFFRSLSTHCVSEAVKRSVGRFSYPCVASRCSVSIRSCALSIVKILCVLFLFSASLPLSVVHAQRAAWHKLSPFVRQAVWEQADPLLQRSPATARRMQYSLLTAFVRFSGSADSLLAAHGGRSLASYGSLHIVSLPLSEVAAFSLSPHVLRMETGMRAHTRMDSVRRQVHADVVHTGFSLPQAFRGRGVLVGVMDIGFDLLHPTFFSADGNHYRIEAMWDQLSTDTIGSTLYVGRDYEGASALQAVGCPRDGYTQTHGTHTAGIAAGSGYDAPYVGMAPESGLCFVCNATSDDIALIDSADYYKYTYATDALGFKYIFDHASRSGRPCVINFSEGSSQDFHGDDALYYEWLDSLTGPGRIIVASAGNDGERHTYFRKAAVQPCEGGMIRNHTNSVLLTLKSAHAFSWTVRLYGDATHVLRIASDSVLHAPDSVHTDTLRTEGKMLFCRIAAYPSSYNPAETCYDVYLVRGSEGFGTDIPISVAVEGDADAECYVLRGTLYADALAPELHGGERSHSVNSPSSAPSVISVGATAYRSSFVNYRGDTYVYDQGHDGALAGYSSRGPTYDGRVKPDVVAPGTNIISAYSSFYYESPGTKRDEASFVRLFPFRGRTFLWASNAGTSMSAPVVTGAVALWLEADPTLSPEEVLQVLAHTARRPDAQLTYPNNLWGYGEIDVYAGLLHVLGATSIEGISMRQPRAVSIGVEEGAVSIRFASVPRKAVGLRIYTRDGKLQYGSTVQGDSRVVLPPGLYIVQIDSPDAACCGSSIVRL